MTTIGAVVAMDEASIADARKKMNAAHIISLGTYMLAAASLIVHSDLQIFYMISAIFIALLAEGIDAIKNKKGRSHGEDRPK